MGIFAENIETVFKNIKQIIKNTKNYTENSDYEKEKINIVVHKKILTRVDGNILVNKY